MIRQLNQLATKISHTISCVLGRQRSLAFIALSFLFLLVSNSAVWAQDSAESPVPERFFQTSEEVSQAPVVSPIADATEQDIDATLEFLGVPLWDDDLFKMIVRFLFNLFFLGLVVGISYSASNQKNQRYLFNFVIMNIVVFFICFTLKKLELELGMALGLFAIFGILRYRTDQIDVKDMTYLFVVIGLAVVNALSNRKTSYVELVFTNSVVFGACLFMELFLGPEIKKVKLTRSELVYEKLDLLRPENVEELYEDIYQRTGIRADRVEIKQIDFQNGTSLIDVRQSKERAFVHQEDVAASNNPAIPE